MKGDSERRDVSGCCGEGGAYQVSDRPSVTIIIPAFNEAGTIGRVVLEASGAVRGMGLSCETVVVDDGSGDGTGAEALAAGARVVAHPYNIGNGAAIKSGIRNARGDILLMLDADGQHPADEIPHILKALDEYDMAVAARSRDVREAAFHRNLANVLYNRFASYVCGRKISDLTSGFRAIRAEVAREILPLLPNTFSYPTTMTIALMRSGYSVLYHPIKTISRKGPNKSKIKLFRDGTRFLLIIFKIATLFSPMKIFLPFSAGIFGLGFLYGAYRSIALRLPYGMTAALLIGISILIFLIGLVSEQIAQQRYENINLLKQAAEFASIYSKKEHS